MLLSLFTFLFLSSSWAQYSEQPVKESTADLRVSTVLFSINLTEEKKTLSLERTAGHEYLLRQKIKQKETITKIAGKEAQKLDQNFAAGFIRCQYEIPEKEGKCEV